MESSTKKHIALIIGLLIIVLAGFLGYRHRHKVKSALSTHQTAQTSSKAKELFNDLQADQLAAAKKNGIKPQTKNDDVQTLVGQGELVKIKTCQGYKVDHLTHSLPYLVPKASKLLDNLAKEVQEETKSKSRFIVTSLLRTEESQKQLSHVNGNATSHSCHMYGTTFDITYARFETQSGTSADRANKALVNALQKYQSNKQCYVKLENRQKCYHITVR